MLRSRRPQVSEPVSRSIRGSVLLLSDRTQEEVPDQSGDHRVDENRQELEEGLAGALRKAPEIPPGEGQPQHPDKDHDGEPNENPRQDLHDLELYMKTDERRADHDRHR